VDGAAHLSICDQHAERELAALPQAEQHHRAVTEMLTESKAALAQSEQAKSLAETNRAHCHRILQQLQTRREHLSEEQGGLLMPDAAALTALVAALAALGEEVSGLQKSLAEQQALTPRSEQVLLQASQDAEDSQGAVTRIDAQIQVLEKLQLQQHRDEKVQQFLTAHGLQSQAKLWELVQVEPGWDDAFESVLGMRLNGIKINDMDGAWRLDPPPPPGVTLFDAITHAAPAIRDIVPWTPLSQRIVRAEPEVAGVLADWLERVYVVDSWQEALALRHSLPGGAVVVSREGHLMSRHTMSFFAPQAEMHGLIARAREIVGLKAELSKFQQTLIEKRELLAAAEGEHRHNREQIAMLQSQLSERQAAQHAKELERLFLSQQSERVGHRRDQIERELSEIAAQARQETLSRDESVRQSEQHEVHLQAHRLSVESRTAALLAASAELNERRSAAQAAERAVQEARFFERSCRQKLQVLETSAQTLGRRIDELSQNRNAIESELAGLVDESLLTALRGALELRNGRESELTSRRESLESVSQSLTAIDRERLTAEQKISPLKDKISDVRLKEQEARLSEENAAEQLLAHGGVEAELLPLMEKRMRSGALSGEITRLNIEIEALGAVNLAALSELETAQQRKDHLDSQSQDLNEAVETLETAIHRIDRETRERLQGTFDQVNENFSTLFPLLFGGGTARIELTGVEILDAGLTVIAQPPGKKTSSIHLLSGGEKALTAVALVFALFRLNPAPFCLLDEVDAPLDETNTERFCELVKKMSEDTQFLFISHNKITMELANQLIGITMQESGVSRVVDVDIEQAMRITEEAVA
ncbi:MAG: AAA family ATPase, partial [Pseudomonadota bacterium]|nr:AAA family ATPase [Pseudomonadota bacterium]